MKARSFELFSLFD